MNVTYIYIYYFPSPPPPLRSISSIYKRKTKEKNWSYEKSSQPDRQTDSAYTLSLTWWDAVKFGFWEEKKMKVKESSFLNLSP